MKLLVRNRKETSAIGFQSTWRRLQFKKTGKVRRCQVMNHFKNQIWEFLVNPGVNMGPVEFIE